MRILHFGSVHSEDGETWGDWALHLQCPWRLERGGSLITGSADLFEWASGSPPPKSDKHHNYEGCLQDALLGIVFGERPGKAGHLLNRTDGLVVVGVEVQPHLGFTMTLSGNYTLTVFPVGTRAEAWRFFDLNADSPHFVVVGGRIEY
jgi:hypothetical protein